MAVATAAPIKYERQTEHAHASLAPTPATPRWGPPIWQTEAPMAALERPPVSQIDIITLSLMLAYRPE